MQTKKKRQVVLSLKFVAQKICNSVWVELIWLVSSRCRNRHEVHGSTVFSRLRVYPTSEQSSLLLKKYKWPSYMIFMVKLDTNIEMDELEDFETSKIQIITLKKLKIKNNKKRNVIAWNAIEKLKRVAPVEII